MHKFSSRGDAAIFLIQLLALFVTVNSFATYSPQASDSLGLIDSGRKRVDDVTREPRLIFLFMASDSMPNERLWLRFFQDARVGQFEAFVHCVDEDRCRQEIELQDNFTLIKTVPSKYCSNLVDPMIALLRAGLASRGNLLDKMVFVSYDSIPVKPFGEMYNELIENRAGQSDFCLAPVPQWTHERKHKKLVVKHHQWFVLTRVHADVAVANDDEAKAILKARPLLPRFITCADEFWGFAAVFGRLDSKTANGSLEVSGLSGGPLQLTGASSKGNQGRCDTFVDVPVYYWPIRLIDNWKEFAGEKFAEISQILHKDPSKGQSLAQTQSRRLRNGILPETSLLASTASQAATAAGNRGPQKIQLLWQESLQALRNSGFLFARKVSPEYTKVATSQLTETLEPDPDALSRAFEAVLLAPQSPLQP